MSEKVERCYDLRQLALVVKLSEGEDEEYEYDLSQTIEKFKRMTKKER